MYLDLLGDTGSKSYNDMVNKLQKLSAGVHTVDDSSSKGYFSAKENSLSSHSGSQFDQSADLTHEDSNNSYEMAVLRRYAIGNNHLRLSLLVNLVLIVCYPLLFTANWYEDVLVESTATFPTNTRVILTLLHTTVQPESAAEPTHFRTQFWLDQNCQSKTEFCATVDRFHSCFIILILTKAFVTLLSLCALVGLGYIACVAN